MEQSTDQIIQLIIDQTNFSKSDIIEKIDLLGFALEYHLKGEEDEIDPIFLKLLAQELNVDLGEPSDYLYTELIYDKSPILVRIIPSAEAIFTCINHGFIYSID